MRVVSGGNDWTKAIGTADDFHVADNDRVLTYYEAQDKVRVLARAYYDGDNSVRVEPVTVGQALEAYETELKARGGDPENAARVRFHLPDDLTNSSVSSLTTRTLRTWRDELAKKLAPATVNRTVRALKAALNQAVSDDGRIANKGEWVNLKAIPDAEESRNIILSDDQVRAVLSAAAQLNTEFGLFVEVLAVTGARPSQAARIMVQDLQSDRPDPRLMMPVSRKGRGQKKITHQPVPIPSGLADRLSKGVAEKSLDRPLLLKPGGAPWKKSDHREPFKRVTRHAGLNPDEVTIYALRHSSIVRQILAGVPVRVVAALHDTSVVMIERTYSRFIADHADALARTALLDTSR
ncbi:MAG TPA: tyrosine-type recombinase/integrase [Stellaceae bacterium]|jgi:integrase|nr:tyrosine-type recombinase/integrase [Stellaceae bacterium]